ncbi:MAG: DUF4126 domain-containing protein [Coriobacteriales bacterium]|nr:DUF4126 domain-containing protein [Coriobacteriales bacterium]MBQ6585667.1 DUF4126 domain-containing protein [Coriobacteriales bacterium]
MATIDVAQLLISLALGMSLAASCGFRVFVPLFVTSAASLAGMLQLSDGFGWLATWPALISTGIATVCEILAYYIPAFDNFLDSVSVPSAAVAGTVLTASMITTDMSPLLKWGLAMVAGGGTATAVSTATASLRAASTTTTAGLANHGVATAELGASAGLSVLSIVLPVLAIIVTILAIIGSVVIIRKFAGTVRAIREKRAARRAAKA